MGLSSADQDILDRRVRHLVGDAVIEEHRAQPFGPHSPELTEILHFLRRSPDPDFPLYVVLCSGTPPVWTIGRRSRERGGPLVRMKGSSYQTRAAAEHAVFLARLGEYGLWSADRAVPADEDRSAPEPPPGLLGYVDALSVAPGETLSLHVKSSYPRWRADLVRLLCADMSPEGPGLREEIIEGVAPVACEALEQRTPVGSYVRVDIPDHAIDLRGGLSLRLFVMSSLPGLGVQALISHRDAEGTRGWSLRLNAAGAPSLWIGGKDRGVALELDDSLVRGCWYEIAAVIDPGQESISLACRPAGTRAANRVWIGRGQAQQKRISGVPLPGAGPASPLLLASGWLEHGVQPREPFDGRLEQPTLFAGAAEIDALLDGGNVKDLIASWDFSTGIGKQGYRRPSHVQDIGPGGWHGVCVNHPTRAVTSHRWDGLETDFRYAPEEYAAAHFHRDDMTDCAWVPQVRIRIPDNLPSGVYAFRLNPADGSAADTERVPFVVRPPRDGAKAPLLLVLPTNAYLAYANDHVGVDSPRVQMMVRRVLQFDAFDVRRHHHRELGASLYEVHKDGTGICYSSWRRPILTMRPQVRTFNGRAWQFTADMQIVDWLDRNGRRFDVVTDLDLHREGNTLLSQYSCVMTGTHPEYPSRRMLDAIGDYIDGGGRFIYLGGNGLYWVTGYDPEDEQVIEIRRWGGSEAWRALPGEYRLSFTGEPGGIWRNAGRAPQKTTGVGFVAAGLNNAGASYRRCVLPDRRADWLLAGVGAEIFGERGTAGPAAGLEIDAIDYELGTPAGTIMVASSGGRHSDDMLEARENYGMTLAAAGGGRNPRVRSDMVLVPGPAHGGVFSTGSIAWAGSLAHDSNISRIFANVLDRFTSTLPLLDD